jgi:hypothetical protein
LTPADGDRCAASGRRAPGGDADRAAQHAVFQTTGEGFRFETEPVGETCRSTGRTSSSFVDPGTLDCLARRAQVERPRSTSRRAT